MKCEECRFLEHNPSVAENLPPYKCRKDGVRMYAPWSGNCDGFEKKKTNRDMLFDMDDYELALWIKSTVCDAVLLNKLYTADHWLDWLREVVADEDMS